MQSRLAEARLLCHAVRTGGPTPLLAVCLPRRRYERTYTCSMGCGLRIPKLSRSPQQSAEATTLLLLNLARTSTTHSTVTHADPDAFRLRASVSHVPGCETHQQPRALRFACNPSFISPYPFSRLQTSRDSLPSMSFTCLVVAT